MSALRDERGLRRVSGAAAQVVELAPLTTMNDRKANTMKTYLLRDPNHLEPQKLRSPLRGQSMCRAKAAKGKGVGVLRRSRPLQNNRHHALH